MKKCTRKCISYKTTLETGDLTTKEEKCLDFCVQKFLKSQGEIGELYGKL